MIDVVSPTAVLPQGAPVPPPATPPPTPAPAARLGAIGSFRKHLHDHRNAYLVIAVIYAAVYTFIFRTILIAIPSILAGDAVINADELVPFFDFKSQFLDQLTQPLNDLTSGEEFRSRYSILTTWVRYYAILPFALWLQPIISSMACCIALAMFVRRSFPTLHPSSVIRAAAMVSLLFQLIFLYSKITHFYTLIFGFSLFVVSTLLFLHAYLHVERPRLRTFAAAGICATLNPGVHYVLLYGVVVAMTLAVTLSMECCHRYLPRLRRDAAPAAPDPWKPHLRRMLIACIALLFFTVIPYGLFVKFFVLRGITDLSDSTPINYLIIRNSSIPLLHQFSFDIASILDKFLTGMYVVVAPRYLNMFYFFVALIPLLPRSRRLLLSNRHESKTLWLIASIMGLSIWCSLGYAGSDQFPTFHRLLAWLTMFLASFHEPIVYMFIEVLNAIIQVLRFPHRFELIMFLACMILMTVGIALIERRLRLLTVNADRLRRIGAHPAAIALLCASFFIPYFSNWEFRAVFGSGNFAGFLEPYPVEHLREVRNFLDGRPQGKTIMIPPTETQKRVIDANGNGHKFIDKFYIYYLNKPSYYYGLGGSNANKNHFFLFYRALYFGDPWWINTLRDLDIRYVVVNKTIGGNPLGEAEYLKNIEKHLQRRFDAMPQFMERVYENEEFSVYEFTDTQNPDRENMVMSVPWDSYLCYQEHYLTLSKSYDLYFTMSDDESKTRQGLLAVSSAPEKTSMDLYLKDRPERFTRPSSSTFAFDQNQVPSTYYTSVIYSMFTLFKATKFNFMNIVMPGTFDTLTGTFVGLPGPTKIFFKVDVPAEGEYELLLRGITTRNDLRVRTNGAKPFLRHITEEESKTLYLTRGGFQGKQDQNVDTKLFTMEELSSYLPSQIIPVSYQFNYASLGKMHLPAGRSYVLVEKLDKNPMVVEGIAAIDPAQFDAWTKTTLHKILSPDSFFPLAQ